MKPEFYPAAVNLGLAYDVLGRKSEALQVWNSATQSNEARKALLGQQARVMEEMGRLDEAEALLRATLLTDPAQPDAVQHWLHIRQKTCQWPVLTQGIPELPPETLLRSSGPLGVLALTDDVELQRHVTADWIARKLPTAPDRLAPPGGYRHDRIRIGYLSSDFCRHAMSFLNTEVFERHDRTRFEVFGYCSTLEDGSEIRRRVIAGFDHHRVIRDLTDEQAARLIRNDEIDILIDLNGLTARSRLAVMRWRPAPIQATYLGFIGPVPLPELDYLLCDDFVIPPEHKAAYHPAPLSIARTYQANDSKRKIGGPLTRQDVGLPDDKFVLCCFSNHYKVTETMFGAWMLILLKVDHAVLWLAADNPWSHANLRHAAARAGVAPERIVFAERTSPELYMSRLRLADLFLDTFPYNAGTIASDAIRMQLPLLTLCGRSFASRMAGSLLSLIGAKEGVTTNITEYIDTAVTLATDQQAYAAYKRHFVGDAWASTAGDIARFTAEFERSLEALVPVQSSV
jgi:predicted O-linked N-acetylglucosamine transferase (SPINDLY family)